VLFFFSGMISFFIAVSWAYPGRYSLHVMPATCALAVCGAASLWRRARVRR
jgi:hypothetical protein